MKLGKTRNKVSTEFNMSSMTDIVFLLLIFFMLTSTMVTTNALDIVLPKAKGKTDSNKSTSVSIDKDLNFFIDKDKVNEADLEKITTKTAGMSVSVVPFSLSELTRSRSN